MNSAIQQTDSKVSHFSNSEKWSIVLLVLLSYSGISIITIGKAMMTPFHLLMGFHISYAIIVNKSPFKTTSISLFIFMSYVLLLNIYEFENIRITSVIYTLIFGIEATILFNLLSRSRKSAIIVALKIIIVSYFLNLLIGYGLDFFQIKSELILKYVRVFYSKNSAIGRPMGFSTEPSYAAFIICVSYLCHSYLTKHKSIKESLLLFLLVFTSILLSKSAYGLIFISVIILDWLKYFYSKGDRLFKLSFPFVSIILIVGCVLLAAQSENGSIVRIKKFSSVLFDSRFQGKMKLQKLQAADGSAFARIAPTYLLFNSGNERTFNYILGEGAGSSGVFLSSFLTGILIDEGRDSVDTGIVPALIFDYGILGSFLFLIFLLFIFEGLPFIFWILFLLIVPNANINTQLIWFAIICFSTVSTRMKFLRPKYSLRKRDNTYQKSKIASLDY